MGVPSASGGCVGRGVGIKVGRAVVVVITGSTGANVGRGVSPLSVGENVGAMHRSDTCPAPFLSSEIIVTAGLSPLT